MAVYVPNAIGAVVKMKCIGQDIINTLGFVRLAPATPTPGEVQTLAQNLSAAWENNILPQLPIQVTMELVTTRDITQEGGPVSENADSSGMTGSLVGNLLPNSNTIAISFRTGLAGAANRGRNYWAALMESEVTDSTVAPAKIAAIIAAYATLAGPNQVMAGWQWAVISRKLVPPLIVGRALPIVNVVVTDPIVDSQRRRLPGRGN